MSIINKKNISGLLQKYWEGETTLQEEQSLVSYFNETESDKMPIEYQVFKPLFLAKNTESYSKPKLSDHFEDKILQRIQNDNSNQSETESIKDETVRQKKEIRQLRWYARIAASIAIMLVAYIIMDKTDINNAISQKERVGSSLTSVEKKEAIKAYKQTKVALFFVSSKMKQGSETATKSLNKLSQFETILEEVD